MIEQLRKATGRLVKGSRIAVFDEYPALANMIAEELRRRGYRATAHVYPKTEPDGVAFESAPEKDGVEGLDDYCALVVSLDGDERVAGLRRVTEATNGMPPVIAHSTERHKYVPNDDVRSARAEAERFEKGVEGLCVAYFPKSAENTEAVMQRAMAHSTPDLATKVGLQGLKDNLHLVMERHVNAVTKSFGGYGKRG